LLEEESGDVEALQSLYDNEETFEPSEREELLALFGIYGNDTTARLKGRDVGIDIVGSRAQAWTRRAQQLRSPAQRLIAGRAAERYGLLLSELLDGTARPVG